VNIKYIETTCLDNLKVNIHTNIVNYQSDEVWLETYFGKQDWAKQTKVRVHEIDLLLPQSSTIHYDYENTKRLYTAFKQLSVTQATDERLWAYLAHTVFWKYMRKRWPVENYLDKDMASITDVIQERYFFTNNRDRALIRNGIARLWWYGYVSYDEDREDPFELTKMLLSKLDITQNILERSFSRNPVITKAILNVLVDLEKMEGKVPTREQFRSMMMYLNHLGGVTILDSFEQEEIQGMLFSRYRQMT